MVSGTRQTLISGFLLVFCIIPGLPASVEENNPGVCQQAYGSFSASDKLPNWLEIDVKAGDLYSTNRFDILAGHLLFTGFVDGSRCSGWGLTADGSPNGCGVEVAQPAVVEWQNQFDEAITQTSGNLSLPSRLVKAVISVESQFWPGSDWAKGEVGLGQLTNAGADMILTWRPGVYTNVCSQVYSAESCRRAYADLDPGMQAALRGKILQMNDVSCPICKGGVNLEKSKQSISLINEGIAASCQQSAYLVHRFGGGAPSTMMSYEDFMKLTLANYHAGSGCTLKALQNSFANRSWNNLAFNFPQGCQSAPLYVQRVMESIQP